MAHLLDLPDELILMVIDYLQMDITQVILPFHQLENVYNQVVKQNPRQRVKNLRSLLLASRRLNNLLKPKFYRDICVREKGLGINPLEQLMWTLEEDPSLKEQVISAIVPCDDSIFDAYRFFWFANIETLSILRFKDMEPLEWEGDSHVGTSPVIALNLIDCGAYAEALADVLSWPAALEELHYDADQYYEDDPEKAWTLAALVRALQPQKASLRKLTLTRPPLVHEGLGEGPRIDLRDFTALTTLRIHHVFLCGIEDPHEAWRALPRSLEVLEVFYDDTDLTRFLEEGEDDRYDVFLLELIRHKRTHLPHLRTVSINSQEVLFDEEIDNYLPAGPWTPPNYLPAGPWTPPSSLAHELETAGVNLDVWIGSVDPPNFEEIDIEILDH